MSRETAQKQTEKLHPIEYTADRVQFFV